MKLRLLCFFAMLSVGVAQALPNYTGGSIKEHTATTEGLMIMTTGAVPDNCQGTPYGWLLIPEANRTLMAVTLMAIMNGTQVTVYTKQRTGGFCVIEQVDPAG